MTLKRENAILVRSIHSAVFGLDYSVKLSLQKLTGAFKHEFLRKANVFGKVAQRLLADLEHAQTSITT